MSAVAVTGVAGYLGQAVLRLLDADSSVDRVIGIDAAEPLLTSPKLEFHQMDVRDARLEKVVSAADALVHLAFVVDPIRDEERMRSVNVDGTRNALEAADAAGIRAVVYASSASAYGAHPDNDFPLTEDSPLRANLDFPYAAHKLECERLIDSFRRDHPDMAIAVLRPAIVFGPNVENFVSRAFEAPRLTTVKGYEPPLQFVHEEDVAAAVHLALARRLDGPYNVSADGWLSHEEIVAIAGKKKVELPEAVAFSLAERLWRAGLTTSPPGELHYIMHPYVLDSSRLRAEGWAPRYSNRETLLEALEAHRPWVSLGRVRTRKADLARGVAATLGVVGAMALVRRGRRREEEAQAPPRWRRSHS